MLRKFILAGILLSGHCFAEKLIWKGEISSDGTPSDAIELTLNKTYVFKSSGQINLGKWRKAGVPLGEDSCYEYEVSKAPESLTPEHFTYLRNSIDISLCNGQYNPDHTYKSKPFKAEQNSVHFWIWDTDYTDNTGSLHVEIIELDD